MGGIELSAADDELIFGEETSVRKDEAVSPTEASKAGKLPTTTFPDQSERGTVVSSSDDFLDGVEREPSRSNGELHASAVSAASVRMDELGPKIEVESAPMFLGATKLPVTPDGPLPQPPAEPEKLNSQPVIPAERPRTDPSVLAKNYSTEPEPADPYLIPETPAPSVSLISTTAAQPKQIAEQQSGASKSVGEAAGGYSAAKGTEKPRVDQLPTDRKEPAPKAKESLADQSTGEKAAVRQSGHVLVSSERKIIKTDVEAKAKREAIELFEILLGSAVKGGASDLLLKQGQVPMFRWNGELYPSRNGPRIEGRFFSNLAAALLSANNCERLNNMTDIDFSYQSVRGGRVRVNIFHQRGDLSLVARLIPSEIPTFEKLEMGRNVRSLVEQKRGLILVTGATGSGKSTTLAAMLDFINSTRTSHVITIEDPIEFVHSDKRSMFNQRELGLDTPTYAQALRSALRQAPDVILVGELRDSETVEVALQAAETGHLVLSTLHTNDAADSLLRILGMTGLDKEAVVRAQLADCLRGVVSQRLIKRQDKAGRVAAQEIMINTATIREKLLKGGHPSLVRDVIAQGAHSGMQSFDQHLAQLVHNGIVEYEEALKNATNRDDFALRYSGVGDGRAAS